MGKFDGYLICTDIDGTFASEYNIFGENAEFVKYFQDNGGLFTVSTGRFPDHIKCFQNFKPNCPVITHNGAVIYDLENEEVLYKNALPQTFSEIYDYALGLDNVSFRCVHVNGLKTNYDILENSSIGYDEEYFKVVFVLDDPEITMNLKNELADKFGDRYDIFLGWRVGIECLANNANKGTAVQKLKEILGDKVKKVICVGDSESDAYMFRCADVGYAVENASAEAKDAADRVTIHCTDGAIAQIVKDIENELIKI